MDITIEAVELRGNCTKLFAVPQLHGLDKEKPVLTALAEAARQHGKWVALPLQQIAQQSGELGETSERMQPEAWASVNARHPVVLAADEAKARGRVKLWSGYVHPTQDFVDLLFRLQVVEWLGRFSFSALLHHTDRRVLMPRVHIKIQTAADTLWKLADALGEVFRENERILVFTCRDGYRIWIEFDPLLHRHDFDAHKTRLLELLEAGGHTVNVLDIYETDMEGIQL